MSPWFKAPSIQWPHPQSSSMLGLAVPCEAERAPASRLATKALPLALNADGVASPLQFFPFTGRRRATGLSLPLNAAGAGWQVRPM